MNLTGDSFYEGHIFDYVDCGVPITPQRASDDLRMKAACWGLIHLETEQFDHPALHAGRTTGFPMALYKGFQEDVPDQMDSKRAKRLQDNLKEAENLSLLMSATEPREVAAASASIRGAQ